MTKTKILGLVTAFIVTSGANSGSLDLPPSSYAPTIQPASAHSAFSPPSHSNSWQKPVSFSLDSEFSSIKGATLSQQNAFFSVTQREFNSPFLYSDGSEDAHYASTQMTFAQATDWGQWQFSNTVSHSESQREIGVSLDRFSFSASSGRGDVFVTSENRYQNIDPFLFHGGNLLTYSHSGGSIGYAFSDNAISKFAATRVTSPGVADRYGYAMSLSGDRYEAGIIGVQRDNTTVARGIDLGMSLFGGYTSYTQLSNTNGAAYKKIGFAWNGHKRKTFALSLETKRNPLYRDIEDNRVMFSVSGLFNQPGAVFTNDEVSADEEQTKKKVKPAVFVGAGIAAVAVASSSGSSNKDNAPRIADQHKAARKVLNGINPTSVRENREHGGWVYRNADGSYGSTRPIAGEVASINIGPALRQIPAGSRASASYHTHGGPDSRFINEQFSPQDLISDRASNVDGYLGTPAGKFKYHDVKTGKITTLGNIAK